MARHQRSRFPLVENLSAVLDQDQTRYLLQTLCVRLGFCLPPHEHQRIVNDPPLTVYDFTNAVLAGEGLDPATAEKDLVHGVRTVVAAAFAKSASKIVP